MTRAGRKLSANDRVLWSTVARTVTPLHGMERDRHQFDALAAEEHDGLPAVEPIVAAQAPRPVASPAPAPSTALDRVHQDKLSRGRIAIDGRIDLHGMTQQEAHRTLLAFLRQAKSNGRRHVLVITGKGSSLGSEGALRRAVPHWLATPEFRGLVNGWSDAGRRHGGEGALYVRIARDRERYR